MPSSEKRIELKLVITALDKASKTLDGIASDLSKIVDNQQNIGKSGEKAWTDGNKAARKYQDRLKRLNKDYRELSQQSTRYWETMKGMTALLVGTGAAAVFPIRAAAKFERAMSRVVAVTTGAAGRYEELSEKAKELGRDTLYTSEQAAMGMKFLGMTGLNAAQTIEAIGPALDLATLGEMELAKAADYATNIMMGFDKSVEDLTHIINVMAHAATNSNQSVTELAQAMSYVAPVANAAGVSLEQTTAAIGLLSDRGIKASKAGTALRGVIASLTDPTEEALGALQELGVQVQHNADGTLDLIGTLDELNRAGLDSGRAFQIFRRTAAAAAQAMTSNVDQMRSFSKEMTTGVDGAAKRFRKLLEDNLIGQLVKVQAAFNNLMISAGEPFIDWLTRMATAVADWLSSAAEWVDQHKTLVEWIGKTTAALIAFEAIGLAVAATMWAMSKAHQAYLTVLIGMNSILAATGGHLAFLSPALANTAANFRKNSVVVRLLSSGLTKLASVFGLTASSLGVLSTAARVAGASFIWMWKAVIAPAAVGYAIGKFINSFRGVRKFVQTLMADFAAFYHAVAGYYDSLKLKVAEFALKVAEVNPLTSAEELEGHKKAVESLKEQVKYHQRKEDQAVQTRKAIVESFEKEEEASESSKDKMEEYRKLMKKLEKETKASAKERSEYSKQELSQFVGFIEGKKSADEDYADFAIKLQNDLVKKKAELQELEITQQRVIEQEKGLAQQNAAKVRVENKRQEIEQIQEILDKGVDEYVDAEGKKREYLEGSLKDRLDILRTHLSEARLQYEKGTEERLRIEQALIPKIEDLEAELIKRRLAKTQERYGLYAKADEERLREYKKVLDEQVNYAADANGKILWLSKQTYKGIENTMMGQADTLKRSYDRQLEIIQAEEGKQTITHEEAVRRRQVITREYNRRMALIYDELLAYTKMVFGEHSDEWRKVQKEMQEHTNQFVNVTVKRYGDLRDELVETMSDTSEALQESLDNYTDKIREATKSIEDRQMSLEDSIRDIRRKNMSEEERHQSYLNEALEKRRKLEALVMDFKKNSAEMSQEEVNRASELAETYASDITNAYKRFADKGKEASATAIKGLKSVNHWMNLMDRTKIDSFTRLKQQADEALSKVESWIEEFNRRAELKIPVRLTDLRKAVDQINQLILDEENKIRIDIPDEDIRKTKEMFDQARRAEGKRQISFDVQASGLDETERDVTNKARAISEALGVTISEAMNMSIQEGMGDMVGTFKNSQNEITEVWKQESGDRIQVVRNEAGEIVRAGNVMTRSMDDQARSAKEVEEAHKKTSDDVDKTSSSVKKATQELSGMENQSKSVASAQKEVSGEVDKTVEKVEKAASTPAEKALDVVLRNFEEVKRKIRQWADEEITKTVRIKTVEEKSIGGRAGEIYKMAGGGRFPGDSKKDSIHVMARPGEGFVRNEALSVWDRMFGKGFFHGVNNPWSDAGQNIINALKGNLSVSIPNLQQATAPRVQFATGGRVQERPAQNLGTIQFEVDGNKYPVQGDVDVLKELSRAIERKQRMRQN